MNSFVSPQSLLRRTARRRGVLLTAGLVAGTLASPGAAQAQCAPEAAAPLSHPSAIFDPLGLVALSEFRTDVGGDMVLTVHQDILDWLSANQDLPILAVKDDDVVGLQFATSSGNGQVVLADALVLDDATYVVVAASFVDAPGVVTNWNQDLNKDPAAPPMDPGRGGFEEGAFDGLRLFEVDQDIMPTACGAQPEICCTGDLACLHQAALTSAAQIAPIPVPDDPVFGPHEYGTANVALFSDGSEQTAVKDGEVADLDTPGYERYGSENWSSYAYSREAMAWLSDKIRARTGRPILHRNAYAAFGGSGLDTMNDIPLFQLVHAHVVKPEDNPSIPGLEQSLASFILPPFWAQPNESFPRPDYPILLHGGYGVNDLTGVVGEHLFCALSLLYEDHGEQALAVDWNGGGTAGCQAMQASLYKNATQLIADTLEFANGDPHRVVTAGGSRGGGTALRVAANPYDNNTYTVRYALARNPETRIGEALTVFANPAHRLLLDAIPDITGFTNAIDPLWPNPAFPLGALLTLYNLTGIWNDPAFVDDNLVPDSFDHIDALLDKDVHVVLEFGTHDFSKPFTQMAEYYNNLKAHGVKVHCDVSYGFGHGYAISPHDPFVTEVDLLRKVIDTTDNDDDLGCGELPPCLHHWERDANDPDEHMEHIPDDHQPVTLEVPVTTTDWSPHTWGVVGPPGAEYEIYESVAGGNRVVKFSGVLSGGPQDAFGTAYHVNTPNYGEPTNLTSVEYEIEYSLDGTTWWGHVNPIDGWVPVKLAPPPAPTMVVVPLFYTFLESLWTDDGGRIGGLMLLDPSVLYTTP